MCIFPPLSILYMSGWSEVENEQAEWMWRISEEDFLFASGKKTNILCVFLNVET